MLDRVTKVIDRNGKATLYEYDSLGNRSEVHYPNGNVVTYEYDACNRLKEECITNASGVQLSKYTYGIGKAGERTSITEINSGVETDITYKYDKLNRLTKETIERGGNSHTYEYGYDAVSNRTEKKVTVKGDVTELADTDIEEVELTEGTTTYNYNALNQLITEETPDGTKIYTYDDNGNLVRQTGDKTVDYSYDKENHLVKATIQKGNSVTIESYTYDYAGNRLSKTVNESNTTFYVNDTTTDLTQVVAETDNNGNETAYYTRGDELVSMEKEGEICYYLYDGHSNVRILTNEAGRITDRYSYDAYGCLLEKEGDTKNEFLYTGEQYNANTGLYYLRARYMNPETGTFISMDSYQGSIYDPISLHKYLYANANPVMYSDPSGYSAEDDMIALEGETIIAAAYAWQESVAFRIGMQALSQIRALQAVRAVSYISTVFLLDLIINDAFYHRYYTNAYDVVVEVLEYALNRIDAICTAAGVTTETIANQIKTAIYEARNKKKDGKDKKEDNKGGQNGGGSNGGNSGNGNNSNKPSNKPYRSNKDANKQAQKHGYDDAHDLKEDYVGRKNIEKIFRDLI